MLHISPYSHLEILIRVSQIFKKIFEKYFLYSHLFVSHENDTITMNVNIARDSRIRYLFMSGLACFIQYASCIFNGFISNVYIECEWTLWDAGYFVTNSIQLFVHDTPCIQYTILYFEVTAKIHVISAFSQGEKDGYQKLLDERHDYTSVY